mmetsp:Transcript_5252/g.17868  ORF Transcript_5252/g.17868 Transcript_5252/m.17868 type:complete len:368 (+) Transcript_5252:681-1784(+)
MITAAFFPRAPFAAVAGTTVSVVAPAALTALLLRFFSPLFLFDSAPLAGSSSKATGVICSLFCVRFCGAVFGSSVATAPPFLPLEAAIVDLFLVAIAVAGISFSFSIFSSSFFVAAATFSAFEAAFFRTFFVATASTAGVFGVFSAAAVFLFAPPETALVFAVFDDFFAASLLVEEATIFFNNGGDGTTFSFSFSAFLFFADPVKDPKVAFKAGLAAVGVIIVALGLCFTPDEGNTSEKSLSADGPGACRETSGSHAQGANLASSFCCRDIGTCSCCGCFVFFGDNFLVVVFFFLFFFSSFCSFSSISWSSDCWSRWSSSSSVSPSLSLLLEDGETLFAISASTGQSRVDSANARANCCLSVNRFVG